MNIRPATTCAGGVEVKTDKFKITVCPVKFAPSAMAMSPASWKAGQPTPSAPPTPTPTPVLPGIPSKPCNLSETLIKGVLDIWKTSFPDASVLVKAISSTPGASETLTHTMKGSTIPFPVMSMTEVNGIVWSNPLVNNALYSFECSTPGVWGNFYEIMLPEVPGKPLGSNGSVSPSATEAYTNYLQRNGIFVQGDHYHWKGMTPNMYAIHSARTDMCPLDFSDISVAALAEYARVATLNLAK